MSEEVLQVTGLTKSFGGFTAVDGISFTLKKGEVLGLLGPNGAGKTTTIQMLLGLTTPTAGEIKYFGEKFDYRSQDIFQQISFASTYTHLQGRLTIRENLEVYAGFYQLKNSQAKIAELAKLLEIEDLMDLPYWRLSSGQQTRAILAKSLLNSPKLMLMDEPTASLDPDIVDKIIELIIKLKKEQQVSILFTSHNMSEVSRVCDRIIFLDHGHIFAEDTPLGLTKQIGEVTLNITFDGPRQPIKNFLQKLELEKYDFPRTQVVSIKLPDDLVPKVLFGLSKIKVWMTNIEIDKPTLEDVFLRFVRKGQS